MRNLYVFLFGLISFGLMSQVPQTFSYQAVLRNVDGTIMSEQNVALTFNILKGFSEGPVVFTETHNTKTNAFGLVNLQIGSISSLTEIDWSLDSYFAEVFVNGTLMGSTQLLSVPYALHAHSAIESDPIFEASPSSGIESTDIRKWNTAHSWGNHSSENYLTEETDSIFSASPSAGIELSDIGIWNAAHSWGDHAVEDYIKVETQTLSDVAALGNTVNTQLKNVSNPTDSQDAVTKSYVDNALPKVYYSPWINFSLDNWSNSLTFFGQTRREYQVQVPQIDAAFLSEGTVMVFARFGGTTNRIQPLPIMGPILSSARDQVLNFRLQTGLIVIEFFNLIDRDEDPGRFGSGNQYRFVIIPGNTPVQN